MCRLYVRVFIKVISFVTIVQPVRSAIEIHMIVIIDVDTGARAKIALLIITKKLSVVNSADFWRFCITIFPLNPVEV